MPTEGIGPWSWVGSFVRDALEQGWSQRHALEVGREAGMLPRDSVFRDVWHSEVASRARARDLADLPGQSTVPDQLHNDWAGGREGTKLYQVHVQVLETETGDVHTRWHTVVSDDALSPNDVEGETLDAYEQGLESGTGEGQVILGATLVGAHVRTGQQR